MWWMVGFENLELLLNVNTLELDGERMWKVFLYSISDAIFHPFILLFLTPLALLGYYMIYEGLVDTHNEEDYQEFKKSF